MKKLFMFVGATLLSLSMLAENVVINFTSQTADGDACTLTEVLVENLSQNWQETITGPDFSFEMAEISNGLETISSAAGSLGMAGNNPFMGTTQLHLLLNQSDFITLNIVDVMGRIVCSFSDFVQVGEYNIVVNLSVPQLYFATLTTSTSTMSLHLINMGASASNSVSVVQTSSARRVPMRVLDIPQFAAGDQMRYTGKTVISGETYTDVVNQSAPNSSTTIRFTFTPDPEDSDDPNDPDDPDDPSDPDEPVTPAAKSGLSLGIIGFNTTYYIKSLDLITKDRAAEYKRWIDNEFEQADGTMLYHAVWQGLEGLQAFNAPDDLTNVSIITFTDGIDQNSFEDNPLFVRDGDNIRFADSIQHRMTNDKVKDIPLSAYGIGVKGKDVGDTQRDIEDFDKTLKNLSSQSDYKYNMENMDEVSGVFQEIAKNLYKENNITDLDIFAPGQIRNMNICWTFDITDEDLSEWYEDSPSASKIYISGKQGLKFNEETQHNDYFLFDIKCEGLTYAGMGKNDTIWGREENKKYHYDFKNVRDLEGQALIDVIDGKIQDVIKEWKHTDNEWAETEETVGRWKVDSEFNPQDIPDLDIKKSSAVIMLVLDCSTSLGKPEDANSDFQKLKKAAKEFIDIITEGLDDKLNDNDDDDDDNEDTYTVSIQQANSIAEQLESGETTTDSYRITGYVSAISEISTEYGNATFTLSDGSNTILCYRLRNVGNTSFTSSSQLTLNDRVTVIGKLKNWKGTLELADGYIVSRETSQQLATYYIKHSWGSGADADWTWQPMNYNSAWGAYYYTGAWGGYGVNINTVPSDTGSEWFDMSSAAYNNDWSIGQTITFIYDPSSDTVTYEYY